MSKTSTASTASDSVRKRAVTKPVQGVTDDRHYAEFLSGLRVRFNDLCTSDEPLLRVSSAGLYAAYLSGIHPEFRQQHTCDACRRFIENFGGIVYVTAAGQVLSPFWDVTGPFAPSFYVFAMSHMAAMVSNSPVEGVFVSKEAVLGAPTTGEWSHMSVKLPPSRVWTSKTVSAGQQEAAKAEDFKNVRRALGEYDTGTLSRVVSWLESDALYRAENVLGPAKWLLARSIERDTLLRGSARHRNNLLWRAVAVAPAGFCHPRSSMVGTLLDDIAQGVPFDRAAEKFKAKMDPLKYRRPQEAPKAGTIAQAEKLFEQLDLARSLPRRLCQDSDIQGIWYPSGYKGSRRQQVPVTGVFADVQPRGSKTGGTKLPTPDTPANTITWVKFAATVLPNAVAIEHLAKNQFATFTTAVHEDSEPILMWDRPEARNPVAWFFWSDRTDAERYGLRSGSWEPVDIIALAPHMWYDGNPAPGKSKGVLFVIRGAKETIQGESAGGLFPENLRPELHGVRAVIEAKKSIVAGAYHPHVCGVFLQEITGSGPWNARFRVKAADGSVKDYNLDRWD